MKSRNPGLVSQAIAPLSYTGRPAADLACADSPHRELNVIRIAVIDDHAIVRNGLRQFLSEQPDLSVVAEADNGKEAVDIVRAGNVDVILMDLSMPDLSGIDAMKKIHERKPDMPVVILTAHADPGVEKEAREAGASGFLAKGVGLEDLVIVLHEAAEPGEE